MIAKRVRVNVYGEINEGLYTGYANAEGVNNVGSYIISRKSLNDFMRGVVVAVATLKSGEQKCIVAPEGEIYYEPEIREKLKGLRNVEIQSLNCLYEKSCGAIIIYKANENNHKVLLVKNHNGRYWSFPKGHVEKGETEQQTAIREIKEETGLDVEIVDSFREVSDYCPFGRIKRGLCSLWRRPSPPMSRCRKRRLTPSSGSTLTMCITNAPTTTTCALSRKLARISTN